MCHHLQVELIERCDQRPVFLYSLLQRTGRKNTSHNNKLTDKTISEAIMSARTKSSSTGTSVRSTECENTISECDILSPGSLHRRRPITQERERKDDLRRVLFLPKTPIHKKVSVLDDGVAYVFELQVGNLQERGIGVERRTIET